MYGTGFYCDYIFKLVHTKVNLTEFASMVAVFMIAI